MSGWLDSICFGLVSLGGGFIQTFAGFGFGIFVIAFYPLFMPSYQMSVSLSNMLSISCSTGICIRDRKAIAWKKIVPLILAYGLSSTLVILVSANFEGRLLKKVLGGMLVLYGLFSLRGNDSVKVEGTKKNGILAGLASGVLGGLFGTGGPPVVIYLLSVCQHSREYYATIQTYFCLVNLYSVGIRWMNGLVTWETMRFFLMGIPSVLIGSAIGRQLIQKMDGSRIKKWIYCFLIVNGFIMGLQ